MPATLEQLLESNHRSADATLKLADAINKLLPTFDRLRNDVYDLRNSSNLDRASLDLTLRELTKNLSFINERLKDMEGDIVKPMRELQKSAALLLDNVKDVQSDITHPRIPLLPPEPVGAAATITAFEKLSVRTKIMLLAAVIIAGASGWLRKLFE